MNCIFCEKFCINVNQLFTHIKFKHNDAKHFSCNESGCHRQYQNLHMFKKHLVNKHKFNKFCVNKGQLDVRLNDQNITTNVSLLSEFHESNASLSNVPQCNGPSDVQILENVGDISSRHINENIRLSVINFISKLHNNASLNRTDINQIINDTAELFSTGFITMIKNKIKPYMTNAPVELIEEIEAVFNHLDNPFFDLKTEHLRIKYFEKSNYFIKPQSFAIGTLTDTLRKNDKIILNIKESEGIFISMIDTLQAFLELPGVLEKIFEYKHFLETSSNSIQNLMQANYWRKLVTKLPNKILLPLIIYYDDFESSNPLGSHAGVYKIGAVYYTLPVIPPQYSSQLDNIFLVQLFNANDKTAFGNHAVFSKLVAELTTLENTGLNVKYSGQNINICFPLVLLVGDNLGIHSVLGYHESFSSNYPCRFCIADKKLIHSQLVEDTQLARNEKNYETDVATCSRGIKERCVFNSLPNFHPTKNTACDIMHDLLEGVCRYDMAKIISTFIKDRYFTLNSLNNRIRFFQYNSLNQR
ncbi:hypothetical protein PPYR_09226 [Photinus pyralis]|uniref:C2H2-type domain-containing protein n=2 Tax=Photinus pyralis TaxID=7054 RepID=A0A5N4ALU9_PHOPY|nr:uncharacterized protein LOC116168925 [Photinus pyralis]XP_031340808.1 uncharacterized protein LOC116168925 [Photinus pyralis]XP_031340815.1 uncharacterized protein LOC116168925 [Photinus pyralis]XP_031345108.1 uncharacterized protein LOC116172107 isoform X1 [Photinus pyralis]XP_031345109.1 uncharacterized protein LOC116172107 isoform X1 [Photinus pyralis]XP_031345110.1 uncharacterized protein LOC116172107 isoform X1 [Photinus pyralis]KAB0798233.1 hypothetical protein PPYR_09226 [Photinus p